MITLRRASERGHADHGWLQTFHTFSFADYHDPAWMAYRSLRVINDDTVAPGMGFGMHPHRDMEIITYVLSGALEHKDSLGNGSVIHAGDVQYMAAGTGVRHSEFNPSRAQPVHLLQIWILPDTTGVAPRYAEKSLAAAAPGRPHLVASKSGRDGSIAIHQDADLWIAALGAGDHMAQPLPAARHTWLHVADGELTLDGTPLHAGDAAALAGPADLQIVATTGARVLLFDLA